MRHFSRFTLAAVMGSAALAACVAPDNDGDGSGGSGNGSDGNGTGGNIFVPPAVRAR